MTLCGRNAALRERLAARFGREPRVTRRLHDAGAGPVRRRRRARALDRRPDGLEAWALGCPTISYGWGRGHIRANNRAYVRFGIADVARDRDELARTLRRVLARAPLT